MVYSRFFLTVFATINSVKTAFFGCLMVYINPKILGKATIKGIQILFFMLLYTIRDLLMTYKAAVSRFLQTFFT